MSISRTAVLDERLCPCNPHDLLKKVDQNFSACGSSISVSVSDNGCKIVSGFRDDCVAVGDPQRIHAYMGDGRIAVQHVISSDPKADFRVSTQDSRFFVQYLRETGNCWGKP